MTSIVPSHSALTASLALLVCPGLVACDSGEASDLEEAALASPRDVQLVPPNPRTARVMSGEHDFAVVFVQLQGIAPPQLTPSDLSTTLGTSDIGGFIPPGAPPGPGFKTVAQYYQEVSFNKFRVEHTVIGGVAQIAHPPGYYCSSVLPNGWGNNGCDDDLMAEDFLDAASDQLAFDPHAHDGVIFVVAGQAYPGLGLMHTHEGDPMPIVLLHGAYNVAYGAPLGEDQLGLYNTLKSHLIHEIGHAVGDLWHNGGLQCPFPVVVPEEFTDCTLQNQTNPLSPMSAGAVRHLGAYEKCLVGFISGGQTWVPGVGHHHQVTLTAIERNAPTAYQEIRIPLDDNEFYTVEYRKPIGVDAPPLSDAEASYFYGVSPGEPLHGLVVSLRLASADVTGDLELVHLRQLIRPGETFHDNYRGVHITFGVAGKYDRAIVDVETDTIILEH